MFYLSTETTDDAVKMTSDEQVQNQGGDVEMSENIIQCDDPPNDDVIIVKQIDEEHKVTKQCRDDDDDECLESLLGKSHFLIKLFK